MVVTVISILILLSVYTICLFSLKSKKNWWFTKLISNISGIESVYDSDGSKLMNKVTHKEVTEKDARLLVRSFITQLKSTIALILLGLFSLALANAQDFLQGI